MSDARSVENSNYKMSQMMSPTG